jgi:hypothetical protein
MPAVIPVLSAPVKLTAPFAAGPATSGTFGSAVIGGGLRIVAPVAPPREPGDYLARFAAKGLSTTREVLYRVPRGTRAVVRHFGFVNDSGLDVTGRLWVGGLLHVPTLTVPASKSRAQDLPEWVLLPGETIEGQASGAGLNVFLYGIEEVR